MSEPSAGLGWLNEHWEVLLQHPVVVSLLGSVLAVWHAFPGATYGAKLLNGVSCFFIGIYAGPALNDAMGTESKRVAAAVTLGCAIGGLVFVNGALEWLRATKFADVMAQVPVIGAVFKKPKE